MEMEKKVRILESQVKAAEEALDAMRDEQAVLRQDLDTLGEVVEALVKLRRKPVPPPYEA